jgi:hypothetical protein
VTVFCHQISVWKRSLGVFVEHFQVAVGWRGVQMILKSLMLSGFFHNASPLIYPYIFYMFWLNWFLVYDLLFDLKRETLHHFIYFLFEAK